MAEAPKVEILDEDLKKYAEDAAKAAKTFQEKQQKALDQGGGAATGGGLICPLAISSRRARGSSQWRLAMVARNDAQRA